MVTFALSGHRRRLRLAVHGAALALWAIAALALLGLVIESPSAARLALLAGWTLAGTALLWNCRRPGAGRETLTLDGSTLVLRRVVGPFRFTRQFALDRIDRVHAIRLPGFAPDRYRIEFACGGRTHRFGWNLSGREVACITGLIRRAADDVRMIS